MTDTHVRNEDYEAYIAASRYAKYLDSEGRRESWEETIHVRWADFWSTRLPEHEKVIRNILAPAIFQKKVMPSMRSVMTAGKALDRDEAAGYNCAYLPIESLRDFDETLYILMCGTGVGFSVEKEEVGQLPTVAETFHDTDTIIHVADSKIGWASAYREFLALVWAGKIPKVDVSKVRPAGARLKTFGGRASGPDPLVRLFSFTTDVLRKAAGRKVTPLEAHDIVCKIAEVVVVGGVRRSALISLSDLGDGDMQRAKHGQWWLEDSQRGLANNSAIYDGKPSLDVFINEWKALYASKSGERGIFNRDASTKQAAKNGRRDTNHKFGTNPCSEIILRPRQFCNLSEVVVRAEDTPDDISNKVKLATIIGTMQSTLTNFRYLRAVWRRNTEEERLLGVSLTGIMDNKYTSGQEAGLDGLLESWKNVAVETNKEWAEVLGVPQSAAITCVKPSGTVSQLVDSASGIHPRFAPYYIRTTRQDAKDPLTEFLRDQGVPMEPAIGAEQDTMVLSWPMKAPEGAVCNADVTAEQQFHTWLQYQRHWCEHKPSVTIYYSQEEFLSLGQLVYNHFDEISGISFLPRSEHSYQQAPYQEITHEEYNKVRGERLHSIDWSLLSGYERGDTTTSSQELACVGGSCEL